MNDDLKFDLDLGHDHYLKFTHWAPDDLPSNHKWLGIPEGESLPVVDRWGAMIRHGECESGIQFDGEWQRKVHELSVAAAQKMGHELSRYIAWTIESWEPLTISPSLLCLRCQDHGHIKNGRWVPA